MCDIKRGRGLRCVDKNLFQHSINLNVNLHPCLQNKLLAIVTGILYDVTRYNSKPKMRNFMIDNLYFSSFHSAALMILERFIGNVTLNSPT